MARVLVVVNPFGGREKGERITDEEDIKKILEGEHAHHVVQSVHDLSNEPSQAVH
jgi:hypothetical protein